MSDNDKKILDTYLKEIGKEQTLSEKEEKELSELIKQGDKKAAEKLTTANLRFVISIAKHYRNRGMEMEDLISEGNIGMMKAAQKYDATRGSKFVSYAMPFIKKAIERAVSTQGNSLVSMDAPLGGKPNTSLLNVIEDTDAVMADKESINEAVKNEIKKSLEMLNERERQVIMSFYGIEHGKITMAEIAEDMGLKRERVRQIRDTAIRNICRKSDNKSLKTYLKQ